MGNIIATRTHKTLSARKRQLQFNLMALNGGRPYINARLWRQPNESDRSWLGSNAGASDITTLKGDIPGRRERAYLINDAGRIAKKINDYLFSREIKRDGMDTDWAMDVTTTKLTIDQFWQEVSMSFSAGQWCWLQVDRGAPEIDPVTGNPLPRTLARREVSGDRVYWSVWSSTEVVDWAFDNAGDLLWLVTEEDRYENHDPMAEPLEYKIRTLWQKTAEGVTYRRYRVEGDNTEDAGSGTVSAGAIPFILLGVPQNKPWWYDDVEMIQAAAMNMESLDCENLSQSVYPQLVIPASATEQLVARLQERYGVESEGQVMGMVRELVRGLEYPFVESSEDSGLTRYLMPNTQDFKILAEKTKALRSNLMDMAGLAMFAKESKQVESAEAKQWDHLDVEATLGARSQLLEEAEYKMVQLSKEIDSQFKEYEPVWPHEFSIPNTEGSVANLVQLGNIIDLPDSVEKWIRGTVVELLSQINHIPDDRKQVMLDEIEKMESRVNAPTSILTLDRELAAAEADGDEEMAAILRDKIAAMEID